MSTKNLNRWNINFIDFRDYCTERIRLPRKGEASSKVGTDLCSWFVNQTKDINLSAFQNNLMVSLLGENWRAGIKACEEYLEENVDLHKAFPQLKDKGYNFSILTLNDMGILSKKDTISYINKGVTSLYKLHDVNERVCSYKNISKLVSLPPYEYCTLYILIYYVEDGIVSTFKDKTFDKLVNFCKWAYSNNVFDKVKNGDMLLEYLNGTTMVEIGKQLGISESRVRQKVHLALRELSKFCEINFRRRSSNVQELSLSNFVTKENIRYLNPFIRNGFKSIKDCLPFIHGSKSSSDIAAKLSCVKMRGISAKGVVAISEILFQIKNKYNLE